MNINYFSVPLALIAIAGTFLIIKKHKEGWLLWEIECGGFFWINLQRGDWGEAMLWLFYFIINFYGYMTWRKDDL